MPESKYFFITIRASMEPVKYTLFMVIYNSEEKAMHRVLKSIYQL